MAEADITWPDFKLTNGLTMPAIGLGTNRLKSENMNDILDDALGMGYRLFDMGVQYGTGCQRVAFNSLLTKHDINRQDIFVIGKINNSELGDNSRVLHAYNRIIDLLDLEYLDLCLVQGSQDYQLDSKTKKAKSESTWAGLINLLDQGLVNGIGVSNYSMERLQNVLDMYENSPPPVLNQVELSPLKHHEELVSFCQHRDIVVQGFHSLGGVDSEGALLKLPQVESIAKELDVTPAQVLLVWTLQKDCGVVPKSNNKAHIRENFNLKFKLNKEQITTLDNLSKTKEKPRKPRRFNPRRKS